MINLKLNFDLQQDVRDEIMRNEPTLHSQNEMKEFLGMIAPSMKFRILMFQYKRVLEKISMFRDKQDEIEFLLQRIGICFYEPEQQIMSQYDESFRQMIITGTGLSRVFKYIDTRKRILLGNLREGSLVGEINVVFDSAPVYSI